MTDEDALRQAFMAGFAEGLDAPSDPDVAAAWARSLVADYLRQPVRWHHDMPAAIPLSAACVADWSVCFDLDCPKHGEPT